MRHLRRCLLALVCAALATLTACAVARPQPAAVPQDAGPAQRGGTATIGQITEPRSVDPAVLTNAFAGNGVIGNSLFGYLVASDSVTGELSYGLAEGLTTADGGTTWTLTLRAGLTFSDGTPFDATAVAFNWERLKDPAVGSQSRPYASLLNSVTVTDPRTLTFTLTTALPSFAECVAISSLTWIASPAALRAGQQAFDANPIGAGPFVLRAWQRQDRMELDRNPTYFDPERPYLDGLVIRTTADETQRFSTLAAGGLDAMISANAQTTDPAERAGLAVLREQRNGGNGLMLNTAVAPFDDPRARAAVVLAVDPAAVNGAVTGGKGTLPGTLFRAESPFFADVPLGRHDPAAAQALFDQLAAEGKPVRFTMTAYATAESRLCMEAIQAQLAAYTNVTAEIEVLDFAGAGTRLVQRQFQAIGGSVGNFTDPGFPLWNTLRSDRPGNYQSVADPALDAALDEGLTATDPVARKDAYGVVQQRIAELNLYLLYTRSNGGVIVGKDLHGAWLSGNASLQTDALWKAA